MKWPIIIRTRMTEEYRARYMNGRVECAERVAKEQAVVIAQNCEVQESQRRHIKCLEDENRRLDTILDSGIVEVVKLRRQNEELRKEHAGDLQLAHTRYDEFVRDMLDRLMSRAAPAAQARSSSTQQEELPSVIVSAIEEFSFGNPIIAEHLATEAWRRIRANEKPDEIAEKIRAGESPE